jgi:hypothetical protein
VLSGATTVADHLYLFPNGVRLEDEIAAAQRSASAFIPRRQREPGQSQGGLAPDSVVEDDTISTPVSVS